MVERKNLRDFWDVIFAIFALAATAGGVLGRLTGAIRDPRYVTYSLLAAFVFAAIALVEAWVRRKLVPDLIEIPGQTANRTTWHYSWLVRSGTAFGFFTVLGLLGFHMLQPRALSATIVGQEKWIETVTSALGPNDASVQVAYIFDPKEQTLGFSAGDGASFRFTLQKSSTVKWIRLDDLSIAVSDFHAPTGYRVLTSTQPIQEPVVYYAEIGPPSSQSKFSASHATTSSDGTTLLNRFNSVLIDNDLPQSIVVRVNATADGIYRIRCVAQVSSDAGSETIEIGDETQYWFKNAE